MNYSRKPVAKQREAVGLDSYAYNKQNNIAPETPTVMKLTEKEGSMGFIAHFAKAGKTIWVDTQDLIARAGDLADQVVDNTNKLILNCKVGFKNGTAIVIAA